MDPSVEEILITCTVVGFYKFDTSTSEYSSKSGEGPLFVVKRNAQPRFQIIVLNRVNDGDAEDLVEDLVEDFVFHVEIPCLFYPNAVGEMNGLWFYEVVEFASSLDTWFIEDMRSQSSKVKFTVPR
ncbi:hypothetical protein ACLB2K_072479 [Fragaria x ananassa]